ncbi:PREDICTED: F-box protein At3g19880-like [Camelina sativa]|uniref:F-box protein At3g19880-like n=1 Tax=Camelina sativa TaxID=90675 RepID=A0ABM0T882_CAMSA|nr:PREDICTED: F-box protein At3g19880-like [Camelina sativa]
MTIISDLPWELVEEILSRVSITSLTPVGSTCKQWRSLFKDESFTHKHCEIFGSLLHLPFDFNGDVTLSCVREEQLAVLFGRCRGRYEVEIWITTKIESNALLWSKFFKVAIQPVCRSYFLSEFKAQSFFIDKEKKTALVSGKYLLSNNYRYEASILVGEDGYLEELDLRDVFSYVPSSVQIQ